MTKYNIKTLQIQYKTVKEPLHFDCDTTVNSPTLVTTCHRSLLT